MADCFLCEDFVGEVRGDGGVNGRKIGNKDICEQCLAELKNCLSGIEAKSPEERESNCDESDGLREADLEEENAENNDENYNPASAGVKI